MKKKILQILLLTLMLTGCTSNYNDNKRHSESFLPMQIGNYWKIDAQNYTEIKDTARIEGKLYYQFYSLVGGDAVAISYLRIDKDEQLWESWPSDPKTNYLHAKFNGKINDVFFTINDKSVNDNKVTITEKTDNKITFSFNMVYHANLKDHPQTVSYIKGQGYKGNWKSLKINGKIIK